MPRKPRSKVGAPPAAAPSQNLINRTNEDARVVSKVQGRERPDLYVGQPIILQRDRLRPPTRKISSIRDRVASYCGPGTGSFGGTGTSGGGYSGGGGGFGGGSGFGNSGGTVTQASGGNFYSPELSTDFLQLPQSLNEQWNYYRFFYYNEPFVGRALDTHVQLPLSKIRLAKPVCKSKELQDRVLRFCKKWVRRVNLTERLAEIVFNYFLIGEVFIFCEDTTPDMPRTVREHKVTVVDGDHVEEKWVEYDNADEREATWMRKNYKGWSKIRIIPPEQIHIETFPFTDDILIEVIPDAKTKYVVDKANEGDPNAMRIVQSMDPTILDAVRQGKNISLNTDPFEGSFVHYMANKPSQYEPRGHSVLQRCMRTLVLSDLLRQAQVSIASRHMTPVRLVYGEKLSAEQVEELRFQVDLALQDPDYSIITNFQVTWDEMNSNGRLLELSGEYDLIARQLYAGLGVTESLLSGESTYAGDRINLEVLNTRYMALRDKITSLVEEHFLEPMCKMMGFVEEDEDGELVTVVPRLSFTRLALRDHQEIFDALFQLYSKGSLDVDTIYEALNLDPDTITERLEKDVGTLKDASFNDLLRGAYSSLGNMIAENTDFAQKVADYLNLKYSPKEEGEGRF